MRKVGDFFAINTNPVILRTKHYHTFVLTKIVGPFKYIQNSPPANACTFADGDFRLITPARCHIYSGSYKESSGANYAAPYRFLCIFRLITLCLLRFYLELLFVLRRVLFISALTRCILGPCGLRWKRVPAPKVVPPLAPPHGHGSNCLAAHPKKRAMSECM